MNLAHEARSILEDAGYITAVPDQDSLMFYFEDNSLLGFIVIHERSETILDHWEEQQDSFLRHHAMRLRREPNKAWNVYSIHLTSDKPRTEVSGQLFQIEEDFRGTRKLVRAGIETKSDLLRALLPLLPIQNLIAVQPEDAYENLRERLATQNSSLAGILGDTQVHELVALLTEEE